MHTRFMLAAVFALAAGVAAAEEPETVPEEPAVAAEADIYVYPSKGQTDQQLDRDRYECHNWAAKQSHYDPSEPHLAPHQQIQVVEVREPGPGPGAAVGAVTGAIVGNGIAGRHDRGGGALAGAIVGAMIGASTDAARQKQTTTTPAYETQAERARLERQAADYRRAISACLEGRGYTVK
jgi:hypothetical protein